MESVVSRLLCPSSQRSYPYHDMIASTKDQKEPVKEICAVYFNNFKFAERLKKGKNDASRGCECLCGVVIAWEGPKNGYTSLMAHVRGKHVGYATEVEELKKIIGDGGSQSTLKSFIVNKDASNAYAWLDFVVSNNNPFSCVERETIRRFVKMKPMSLTTFMKLLRAVANEHAGDISKRLLGLEHMALIFDAWTSDGTSYFAVYASDFVAGEEILLCIAPLLDEEHYT